MFKMNWLVYLLAFIVLGMFTSSALNADLQRRLTKSESPKKSLKNFNIESDERSNLYNIDDNEVTNQFE